MAHITSIQGIKILLFLILDNLNFFVVLLSFIDLPHLPQKVLSFSILFPHLGHLLHYLTLRYKSKSACFYIHNWGIA